MFHLTNCQSQRVRTAGDIIWVKREREEESAKKKEETESCINFIKPLCPLS